MTGGVVVVLGRTGRNFAAGMSGGIAYVLDEDGTFAERCNPELVGLESLEVDDVRVVRDADRGARAAHRARPSPGASSTTGRRRSCRFVKVMPHDYRAALERAPRPAGLRRRPRPLHREIGRRRPRWARSAASRSSRARRRRSAHPRERVGDHREFVRTLPLVELREQGARCMECGVPFCHHGCPLGNLIPDWNDLVYRDRWREAIDQLHRTNNFPEFTGRLCPAPCEAACVLEIEEGERRHDQADRARDRRPRLGRRLDRRRSRRATRTDKTVAVVGSGPPGSPRAQQLNRAGHSVTVFERDEAAGGLAALRHPRLQDREARRRAARRSSSSTRASSSASASTSAATDDARGLRRDRALHRLARPARSAGRRAASCDGVHFAMEYLYQRNRDVAGTAAPELTAAGKHVIVIGGGDTGADCVASAHREGAASVTQIELLGEPPASRPDDLTPWPLWPAKLRTSYALKEGGERQFAISTLASLRQRPVEQIHWLRNSGAPPFEPVAGTEESHPAELVLLAMGFVGPEPALLDALGVERDARGNVATTDYATSVPRRLRRRRRAPRPVADRVGDRGGPPLRERGRRLVEPGSPVGRRFGGSSRRFRLNRGRGRLRLFGYGVRSVPVFQLPHEPAACVFGELQRGATS